MSRFENHFRMEAADVVEYLAEKLPDFLGRGELVCSEIGDGNVNFVFRVKSAKNGKSVIVKQADKVTRSSGRPNSLDRSRIENELLLLENEWAPGMVPEVYLYDPVMSCIIMEDIGHYENLRYAMMKRETFPTLSSDLGRFLALTLIKSTDIVLSPAKKKELVKRYINPQMCEISERLVFTEPYMEGRETEQKKESPEIIRSFLSDSRLVLEAAKLKVKFQTQAQSLLHGDLHSGSIFAVPGDTKVLDPEFAFYGPAGYDIGNVIAHFIFAWVNCVVLDEPSEKRSAFLKWTENTICQTIDNFRSTAEEIIRRNGTDPFSNREGFSVWYVNGILADSAGYAGTELIRRVVGTAGVKDIRAIEPCEKRNSAREIVMKIAKKLILDREGGFERGAKYISVLYKSVSDSINP